MLEITEHKRGDVVILGLRGKLDSSTSVRLEEKLLALIDGGVKQLIVDFSQLDYISSSGLRVLLIAAKRLKSADRKIVLSSMKDQIKEVFDIAGFSSIFPIFHSQEEAINSFQ
jgi:anti-anti-sigma factor